MVYGGITSRGSWDDFWAALAKIHDPTRGRCTQRHIRKAMVAVGWIDPPEPMPDVVKADLRERAALKRKVRAGR